MSELVLVPPINLGTIPSERWHEHMNDMIMTIGAGLECGSKLRFGEITFVIGLLGAPVSIEIPHGVKWPAPPKIPNPQATRGRKDQVIRTPLHRGLLPNALRRFQYNRETDCLILENAHETVYFWKEGSSVRYTYIVSPNNLS